MLFSGDLSYLAITGKKSATIFGRLFDVRAYDFFVNI